MWMFRVIGAGLLLPLVLVGVVVGSLIGATVAGLYIGFGYGAYGKPERLER